MMSGATIVVTLKRDVDLRVKHRLRAKLVGALPQWSGLLPVVELRKLKTRTIILTDASQMRSLLGRSQVRLGQKTYDTLSDEAVRVALAEGRNIDMRD